MSRAFFWRATSRVFESPPKLSPVRPALTHDVISPPNSFGLDGEKISQVASAQIDTPQEKQSEPLDE